MGDRTVNASKSGYQNPTPVDVTVTDGGMSTADFTLDPIPTPTGVEVGCITYETYGGRGANKHLRITPRIVDDQGAPVAGVGITVDVSGPDAAMATVITDASGHAVVELKNAANGTYSTDVTNVDGFGDPTEPFNEFAKGGSSPSSFGACAGSQAASRGQLTQADPGAIGRAIAAKRRHEASLFASSNQVVGTGVGLAGGEPAIEVYLATGDPRGRSQLPGRIEGFRVEPIVTGLFMAGLDCQRMD